MRNDSTHESPPMKWHNAAMPARAEGGRGLAEGCVTYWLRHSAISDALAGGASIERASAQFGNSPDVIQSTYHHAKDKTREEIIASLFEAVVYQNLATLTKGNTPMPEVLLLGGPNLFFRGLQEAWRHHLAALWRQRKLELPDGRDPASLIHVPQEALYYACL